MKIYYVYPDNYDEYECDGVVVVAENKDKALKMVKNNRYNENYFYESQGKIHVEEVDLTKEYVVLESFA